jgi:hypothetical protein
VQVYICMAVLYPISLNIMPSESHGALHPHG